MFWCGVCIEVQVWKVCKTCWVHEASNAVTPYSGLGSHEPGGSLQLSLGSICVIQTLGTPAGDHGAKPFVSSSFGKLRTGFAGLLDVGLDPDPRTWLYLVSGYRAAKYLFSIWASKGLHTLALVSVMTYVMGGMQSVIHTPPCAFRTTSTQGLTSS